MLEPAQFPEGALEEADNLLSSTAGSNTNSLPDVLSNELQSLNLNAGDINHLSFPLIDENEILSIDSADRLAAKLGCDKEETPVKVRSRSSYFKVNFITVCYLFKGLIHRRQHW